MQKKRSNQLIECMRYIACILICFIHVPFPKPFSGYVILAGRAAVPFFLLLSGYFSCCEDPVHKAGKKLWDVVKVVLIAGAICFLWNCGNSYLLHHNFFEWFEWRSIHTLWNFLLFNRATFLNSVFYYFFMMIYVYIVFIISCKLNITKYIYYLIPVLIVLLFVLATKGQWYHGGNWLFTGIPFFYLGHYLHEHPRAIEMIKGKEIILIIAGYILSLVEKNLQWHTPYIYIGSIVMAVAMLALCINDQDLKCPAFLVKLGTSCSMLVLLFHCQVRDTLQIWLSKDTYWFPLLVVGITTISALGISVLSGLRKAKK